jgi:hypothetical protein
MIKTKLNCFPLAIIACACLSQGVFAAEPEREGSIQFSGETLGSMEAGAGQKFAHAQQTVTLPLEQKRRRSESFQSYFQASMTKFDWRGTSAAQGEYLWLSMPIEYQQQRGRKHLFLVQVEPGLMTDSNKIGLDHIGLNASVVGRRVWRNGGFWQYGLTVDRAFGDYDLRPVLGMGFQASRRTWVELGFPKVQVEHRLSSSLSSFFSIKPAGGVWKEEIKTDTETHEVNLHYTSWQLGLGGDFHWRESVWLSAELGQLRNRRIRANDATASILKGTPGQDRYWAISASLKF